MHDFSLLSIAEETTHEVDNGKVIPALGENEQELLDLHEGFRV